MVAAALSQPVPLANRSAVKRYLELDSVGALLGVTAGMGTDLATAAAGATVAGADTGTRAGAMLSTAVVGAGATGVCAATGAVAVTGTATGAAVMTALGAARVHFLSVACCSSASYSPLRREYSASCCFVPPRANRTGQKRIRPTAVIPLSLFAASSSRPPSWLTRTLMRCTSPAICSQSYPWYCNGET